MPIINGKKWACEPCINGHRSSKCNHSPDERVLLEVRKPGRPLSSCPHPASGCQCTTVRLTFPRKSHCHCDPDPVPGHSITPSSSGIPVTQPQPFPIPLAPNGTANRVQKSSKKKGPVPRASIMTKSTPFDVPQTASDTPTFGTIDFSNIPTWKDRSFVPRFQQSSNSSPSIGTPDAGTSQDTPPLRLGMLGIGGYGTAKDEIGWAGDWPSQYPEGGKRPHPSTADTQTGSSSGNCCTRKTAERTALPQPGSCCSNKTESKTDVPSAYPKKHQYGTEEMVSAEGTVFTPSLQPSNAAQVKFEPSTSQNPSSFAGPLPATHDIPVSDFVQQIQQSGGSHCTCGDACACLRCSEHPFNATTMDWVASMYNRISQEEYGSPVDSYQNQLFASGAKGSPWKPPPNIPTTAPGLSQLMDAGFAFDDFSSQSRVGTVVDSDQDFQNSWINWQDDGQSINFGDNATINPDCVLVEYSLGQCSGAEQSCQCGDGCTCVGCQTHRVQERVGVRADAQPESIQATETNHPEYSPWVPVSAPLDPPLTPSLGAESPTAWVGGT